MVPSLPELRREAKAILAERIEPIRYATLTRRIINRMGKWLDAARTLARHFDVTALIDALAKTQTPAPRSCEPSEDERP